jgi:hypothetical protein
VERIPLAPTRFHDLGSPRVIRNASDATGIDRLNALPDQRWHSVQWQA